MTNYSVELMEDEEKWNDNVERSPMGSIFHKWEFLKVVEKHTSSQLHTLIGYKGQEPIGLFPVFEIEKGPIKTVFSPPPEVGVPFMGPILLNYGHLKQRKRESRHKNFVEKSLDYISDEIGPSYNLFTGTPEYNDLRFFKWADFSVSPSYTYRLDLTESLDEIKNSFRKSKRKNIEKDSDENLEIEIGGKETIKFIYDNKKGRYESQGKTFRLDLEYFYDLNSTLSSDNFLTYIATYEGELVSGFIVFMDENTGYCWQSAGKPDIDLPVNDILYWRLFKDFKEKGLERCDLVGANTPRIRKYKAEFNPELVSYHQIKKSQKHMEFVESLYKKFQI